MAMTVPPPDLTMVVPLAPEPAPRNTTLLFSWRVDETVNVPAASCTTWLSGQALIAAWMLSPGNTVLQIVVRCGSPSEPSGCPSGPSERIPGFQVVIRSEGMMSPGGGGGGGGGGG